MSIVIFAIVFAFLVGFATALTGRALLDRRAASTTAKGADDNGEGARPRTRWHDAATTVQVFLIVAFGCIWLLAVGVVVAVDSATRWPGQDSDTPEVLAGLTGIYVALLAVLVVWRVPKGSRMWFFFASMFLAAGLLVNGFAVVREW